MSGTLERRVPLDDVHRALGATMVPFAGWQMPVRYASDLAEHHAVREAVGLFDVSHMGRIELTGAGTVGLLERVLVSRVGDLDPGRARYTMLCDDGGGVIDDLIVTRLEDAFLIIANAANTDDVLAALRTATPDDVAINHREGHVLLALQGPSAPAVLTDATIRDRAQGAPDASTLRPFRAMTTRIAGGEAIVSRTGYTGEDGFEIACADGDDGRIAWSALLDAGAAHGLVPCGLAARDTLRLEAGLPLHGHELGPELGPFESGFGRVVHLDEGRVFRGRDHLERLASSGPRRRIVGLLADGRRAPRAGYAVLADGRQVGAVTSGAPSPTLGTPVALASVDVAVSEVGTPLMIDVRGTLVPARVTGLPFVPPSARRAG